MPIDLILGVDSINPPLTGIGRYALELARGLPQHPAMGQVRYFTLGGWVPLQPLLDAESGEGRFHAATLPRLRSRLASNRLAVRAYHLLIPQLQRWQLRDHTNSIYHSPNYFLPPFSGHTVATVHDLSHHLYPQFHPAARIDYMRRALPDSLRRADHIVTDAESVRRELVEHFNYPAERITAIPLGANPAFRPRCRKEILSALNQFRLQPQAYSLYVGTIEPRKNLDRLLTAYERLPESLRLRYPLVMAGGSGWCSEHTHEHMRSAASAGWLIYLRYVAQADLPLLYAGARVFVYPSLYEGFGLPVLEAMASGTPVITSNCSSLPEVVGTAGLQIQPEDIPALTATLVRALQDDDWCAKASVAGLKRAAQFSWERCVQQTVQVYEHITDAVHC